MLYKPTQLSTASGRAFCFFEKHRETFVERSCYWKHLAVLQRKITIRWVFHLQLSPRITQTDRLTNLQCLCSMITAHSPHLNPEILSEAENQSYDQTHLTIFFFLPIYENFRHRVEASILKWTEHTDFECTLWNPTYCFNSCFAQRWEGQGALYGITSAMMFQTKVAYMTCCLRIYRRGKCWIADHQRRPHKIYIPIP